MTSMSQQTNFHQQQQQNYQYQTMTASSWPAAASSVIVGGHHHHYHTSESQFHHSNNHATVPTATPAAATYHGHHNNHLSHLQMDQQSNNSDSNNNNSNSTQINATELTPPIGVDDQIVNLISNDVKKSLSVGAESPETVSTASASTASSANSTNTSNTPMSTSDHQTSPLYHNQQQQAHKRTTSSPAATLKSPRLVEQRHYQTDAIYRNQFFSQQQQQPQPQPQHQVVSGQPAVYYEGATNYSQDQDQYVTSGAVQTAIHHHQRHSYASAWPPTAATSPLVSPHQQASISPHLGATPSPTALANQHFHHQQSVSPYGHLHTHSHARHQHPHHSHQYQHQHHHQQPHHVATNYSSAANGYSTPSQLAGTMVQPVHRLHANQTGAAPQQPHHQQHFAGQPTTGFQHQHYQHQHQHQHQHHHQHQQQQQSHQHQAIPQMQLQHHHNHQLQHSQQPGDVTPHDQQQQQFYNQQPHSAYYSQHQFDQHNLHHQHQPNGLRLNLVSHSQHQQQQVGELLQKQSVLATASHIIDQGANTLATKHYSATSPRNGRIQPLDPISTNPISDYAARTGSVASTLSSSAKKTSNQPLPAFQQCHHRTRISEPSPPGQKSSNVGAISSQVCRPQSVSVVSTTSSVASSASGELHGGSPLGACDQSPQAAMKQQRQNQNHQFDTADEPTSAPTTIQNKLDQRQTTISDEGEKESQLEQLHQRCVNILDEQQRISLMSSAGGGSDLSDNQRQDAKLEATQDSTTTNANIFASNRTSTTVGANNGNGNQANGRSKRLRTSFKHNQLREMKKWFSKNQNPDAKDLKTLAQTTGLSKRVLQVWFQNARAKYRRNNARAANQQLYNVNQHTSHMLQFQQQQQQQSHHHHHVQTYSGHHIAQQTLSGHNHHQHQHQHQHHHHNQQQHLMEPAVTSTAATSPIELATRLQATQSELIDQSTQRLQQRSTGQNVEGPQVIRGDSGDAITSFAQLDTE